jgi:hypothetical protein
MGKTSQGVNGLKNWSGKWEGLEWGMGRTGWGVDGLKNRNGEWEGPAEGVDGLKNRSGEWEGPAGRQGRDQWLFEITHLCIMHGAHTTQRHRFFEWVCFCGSSSGSADTTQSNP